MTDWFRRYWHFFAVFGSFPLGILIVSLYAYFHGGGEVFAHVWARNVEAHWGWGTAAYILFGRFVLLGERLWRKRKASWKRPDWRMDFRLWFAIPYAMLMVAVCYQEFWPWAFPKLGDFHRIVGDGPGEITLGEKYKSFADLLGWSFGALAGAWGSWYLADRNHMAKHDGLSWMESKKR